MNCPQAGQVAPKAIVAKTIANPWTFVVMVEFLVFGRPAAQYHGNDVVFGAGATRSQRALKITTGPRRQADDTNARDKES
jgi:hypothetical protein